jgi:hypothetical protein
MLSPQVSSGPPGRGCSTGTHAVRSFLSNLDQSIRRRCPSHCGREAVCVLLFLCKGIVRSAGGAALLHGSALHSPACTPSSISPHHALCLYLASPAWCTSHFVVLCKLYSLPSSFSAVVTMVRTC